MALIVSLTQTKKDGGKLKAKCDTLVFENEAQGRVFIKENKGKVFHVEKTRIIHATDTSEVRS